MLIVGLAMRDLLRDRFVLLCNVAIMAGVLVPMLVLFGVKNGVHQALIGDLLARPATRQVDTVGNVGLTGEAIARLHGWPEVAFVTPRPRSQFDLVNVRAEGGRRLREALAVPSGAGDPNLPAGLTLASGTAVASALLADQLDVAPGDRLQIVTQAEGRPRQLLLEARLLAVISTGVAEGRTLFVPFETVDLIEAFYDAYALPEHGIDSGRPLTERAPLHAGLRAYAHRLEDVAPLQRRIEAEFGIATTARSREVEAVLGLGRNLDLALALTVALAATGLGAALVLGFWTEVGRKRRTLAALALMGTPVRRLSLFPLTQALVTALLGLGVSWGLYGLAAHMAEGLFGGGLPGGASVAVIAPPAALAISLAVLGLVLAASALAAWSAMRLDPAIVLREAV